MSETLPTIALIGAGGGIGTALCRLLHEQGYPLLALGRSRDALAPLEADYHASISVVDARDRAALENALGGVTGLGGIVNLAGSIVLRNAQRTDDALFTEVIDTNLRTAFNCVAAAQGLLRKGGSVVLMSSAAAQVGLANHEAIAAAKAGVEGLMRSAAASGARSGLRVNAVAPGLVDTPLAADITGNPQMRAGSEKMHPLGRLGTPEDVAQAIAYLISPQASWISGHCLGVDGGLAHLR
ncbi:MAG: SDR family oxidoreductase [Planctomycetota bacterium]|nr:MAG: SDR family oxidoreductase [Planctomycetota bacterium]